MDVDPDGLDAVTQQLAEAGRAEVEERVEEAAEAIHQRAREAVGGVTEEGQAVLDAWRRGERFGT